jgi:hypothetical protein
VRIGEQPPESPEVLAVMELVLLLLLIGTGVASLLGWTADSRDGADWRPTDDGRRVPTWPAYRDQ